MSEIAAKYLLVWFLLAIVAVTNGIVRQATYGKVVPEIVAHQFSTITGIIVTGAVVWGVSRFWPLESSGQAWTIGIAWMLLTIAFEFGVGHFVAGHSWAQLLADYNLLKGRVWLLLLVWVTVMPYVFYRLAQHAA
jgi:hypothetical protein